ncbi:hypothetical protein [Polyangium sorediatum]|uniref:Lipoprotein LpqB beta-propeller domain-containing protein n=1 Tax=Polyangium sorediatum TaxID=889274 RepID=A0ABT6NU94_9BACT|nr:hypothetical protein [Polyangium sorediatum]MDI1431717.1 hypothetical protein [Polyangium sorediatum]
MMTISRGKRLSLGLPAALMGLWLGCGTPVVPTKSEPVPAPTTPEPDQGPTPSVPGAEAPPASCAHGLEARASVDVARGASAFFYEDRPSLGRLDAGAGYVYLDHDSQKAFVARLEASGAAKSVREIVFPDKHERSHVVGAFRGSDVVVASVVYHAQQEADIELVRLDAQDRPLWSARVDPSPRLDGTPAIAWGKDEIAVAWTRGPYPMHESVRVALVDAKTGKVKRTFELSTGENPGVPSIVWDGEAYWVGWHSRETRGTIEIRRLTENGLSGVGATLQGGVNPFLLPTPAGLAVAWDQDHKIWLAVLDAAGHPKLAPRVVATHPDPIASPRKPVLAWDGVRFAVAYEAHFHASVIVARDPEALITIVDPNGGAAPPLTLHDKDSSGEMPAVLWIGKEWLVVYNRDRLQKGKTPEVVAARLACREAPAPSETTPAGPCDARTRPAPEALRLQPNTGAASVLSLDDGGWAALRLEKEEMIFVRVDREGKTTTRAVLPAAAGRREPTLARVPGGFAAAWIDEQGGVEVGRIDEAGAMRKTTRLPGDPMTSRPGLAWTSKGLVVAYARGGAVVTALLDGAARIVSQPAPAARFPFQPGDCALGHGPKGLLVACVTGTERTETSVIRVARLDDTGKAIGAPSLASGPYALLRNPSVIGTADGFLIAATGPFAREVVTIELGPNGEVRRPERKLLSSYGYGAFGAAVTGKDIVVFGIDGQTLAERTVCPE